MTEMDPSLLSDLEAVVAAVPGVAAVYPARPTASVLADAARRSRFADVPVHVRVHHASSANVAADKLPHRGFGVSTCFHPPLAPPVDIHLA